METIGELLIGIGITAVILNLAVWLFADNQGGWVIYPVI